MCLNLILFFGLGFVIFPLLSGVDENLLSVIAKVQSSPKKFFSPNKKRHMDNDDEWGPSPKKVA